MKILMQVFCLFFWTASVFAQEIVPELKFEPYEIVGRDTRVFTIIGDMITTVSFIPSTLKPPEEQRSMESSVGLISENDRIHRGESFLVTKGPDIDVDFVTGSHATHLFTGIVSYDSRDRGISLTLADRSAEEHTRTNAAPLNREFGVFGYWNASWTDCSVDAAWTYDDDKTVENIFRPDDRSAGMFRTSLLLSPRVSETWDVTGRILFQGGSFKRFEGHADREETILDGSVTATGTVFSTSLTCTLAGRTIDSNRVNGSLTSAGIIGRWLLMDGVGISAGAEFFIASQPEDDMETRFYPLFSFEWTAASKLFGSITSEPGIILHSLSDIYSRNGLVSADVLLLMEERPVHVDGELGWRFNRDIQFSAGAFYYKTEHSPVFSRSGHFFSVVGDSKIDWSGFRLITSYENASGLGLEGKLIVNRASWNFSGDVPYIPAVETVIAGHAVLFDVWKVRTQLSHYGGHAVEVGSNVEEDGFTTLDAGVERTILKKYITVYCDIRNITNADGSWWTGRYRIPGVGLYIGATARY